MAHKRDRDEHYNAKMQIEVHNTLKSLEEERVKKENDMVSYISPQLRKSNRLNASFTPFLPSR